MSSDRNLLFGVLAFQAGLIDAQQFASGCSLWSANKALPLSQILIDQGWLATEDRDHIDYLVERNLFKHRGDENASLAAAADAKILRILQSLRDPEIDRTLTHLPKPEGYILLSTQADRPESRERYTLTRLHAEGGIGQVWVARDSELSREVALKELKPERASHPDQWDRFLEEARLTSQLQHPGIVPVYELSRQSENQQPFYTMRLVKGRTLREAIKEYHERRLQGTAQALEARTLVESFVGVCHAVAYAHSRGVIHRDLKPQNVILGGFGEVIVLDWGLAKMVDQSSHVVETSPIEAQGQHGQRDETVQGQVLGTPAYMAPEQAAGRIDLVNRSSDVYGLGAILYQILTDRPPFSGSTTDEVLERVRSIAPARPRDLVADTSLPLEAICLRALAKFPEHRYPSAETLGVDVQRWLADEPVSAYPEPFLVRASRWARRHKTIVASAAVLVATLVPLLALGMVLINQERVKTARQGEIASEQAAVSQAVNDFLNNDLLAQADPRRIPDKDLKVRNVLDRARDRVEGRFLGQPLVEARVKNTLGSAYLGLGEYAVAENLLREARTLYESKLPAEDRIRLRSDADLGFVLFRTGSPDARRLLSQTLEAQGRALGTEDRDSLRTKIVLAHVLDDQPPFEESHKLYDEILAFERRTLGETDPATLMTTNDLAVNLHRRGHSEEARKLLETTLATQRRTLKPNDQLDMLASMSNLASILEDTAHYSEALTLLQELLPLQKQSLSANHPDTLNSMMNIAYAHYGLYRYEEALREYEEVITLQKRLLGPEFHRTLLSMRWYANTLARLGRHEAARKVFDETMAIQKRTREPSDPLALATRLDLANMLEEMGRSEESLKLKADVLETRRKTAAVSPHDMFATLQGMAISLTSLGRNREARQMLEEMLTLSTQHFQSRDPDRINAVNGLSWFLTTTKDKEMRDPKRALQLSKSLVDLFPKQGPCWNSYGVAQYRDGNWKGAIESLTRSMVFSGQGDSHDYFFLAMAHWQLGQKVEARKWYDKAIQWMTEKSQTKNPELVRFRTEAEELLGSEKK